MSITERYYDAFISYTHRDTEPLVKEVGKILERRGLRVFLDDVEILTGDIIIERITDAIHNCRYFIAFISPAYTKSGWCRHEMLQMLVKEASLNEVGILPFKIGKSEIPKLLLTRKYQTYPNTPSSIEPIVNSILKVIERDYSESPVIKSVIKAPIWLEKMCQNASLARRCCSHILKGDEPEKYRQKMEDIYYDIAKIRTDFTTQIIPEFYDLFEQLQNAVYRGSSFPAEERERIERTHRQLLELTQKLYGYEP